jgi:hypothetical protein
MQDSKGLRFRVKRSSNKLRGEITDKLEQRERQAIHSLEGPKAAKSKKSHLNGDCRNKNFKTHLRPRTDSYAQLRIIISNIRQLGL